MMLNVAAVFLMEEFIFFSPSHFCLSNDRPLGRHRISRISFAFPTSNIDLENEKSSFYPQAKMIQMCVISTSKASLDFNYA